MKMLLLIVIVAVGCTERVSPVTISSAVYDFGEVAGNSELSHFFTVEFEPNAQARVLDLRGTCTCVVANSSINSKGGVIEIAVAWIPGQLSHERIPEQPYTEHITKATADIEVNGEKSKHIFELKARCENPIYLVPTTNGNSLRIIRVSMSIAEFNSLQAICPDDSVVSPSFNDGNLAEFDISEEKGFSQGGLIFIVSKEGSRFHKSGVRSEMLMKCVPSTFLIEPNGLDIVTRVIAYSSEFDSVVGTFTSAVEQKSSLELSFDSRAGTVTIKRCSLPDYDCVVHLSFMQADRVIQIIPIRITYGLL